MKYLKKYENNNEPKIGDYVIINVGDKPTILGKKIMNTIGKIIDIDKYIDKYGYHIFYTFDNGETHMSYSNGREKIIHFSPNKEDLESILQSTKYNL